VTALLEASWGTTLNVFFSFSFSFSFSLLQEAVDREFRSSIEKDKNEQAANSQVHPRACQQLVKHVSS
jgi:hypothetical protein